jgi:galactose mutarotase-like enzyme
LIYTLDSKHYFIGVDSVGAELTYLRKGEKDFLWNKERPYWQRKAPVLFPIVGKLKDNKYRYEGKEYSLPQHGFARDADFELVSQENDKIKLKLENRYANYPFEYQLSISYSLDDKGLETIYHVKNIGEEPMPFSIGAHPAFRCPAEPDEKFEDYHIIFPDDEFITREFLQDGLRSGVMKKINLDQHTLWLNEELFKDDALVLHDLKSKTILLNGKHHSIQMDKNDALWFGIWKQPGAPFVCLEPWWGLADSVNHNGNIMEKEGIMMLEPGGIWESSFRIKVETLS